MKVVSQLVPPTVTQLLWCVSIVVLMTVSANAVNATQFEEDPFGNGPAGLIPPPPPLASPQPEAKQEESDEDEDEPIAAVVPPPAVKKINEKFVRFHMWDGSIVGGEVQLETIPIRTEFGLLQVPVSDIRKFYPGLNSFPALNSRIKRLVDGLGDKDFDVREKSHRELSGMGVQIRNEIDKFEDGGSAERKKRIAEIKKELDEEMDSLEDDEDANPMDLPLIRGDRIDTPDFSIVGKIEQEEFVLQSKFGELRVMLGDVRMADRSFQEIGGVIKKKFEVDGHTFIQRKPLSTRLRVNKGDRVSIKADGIVQWTNWSTSSSPDGLTNQGQYLGINSGTLIGRIGTTGKPFKIGSKHSFVAKQGGMLFLGISMQDSYINNSGYKWVGKYKTRVEVKPAGTK